MAVTGLRRERPGGRVRILCTVKRARAGGWCAGCAPYACFRTTTSHSFARSPLSLGPMVLQWLTASGLKRFLAMLWSYLFGSNLFGPIPIHQVGIILRCRTGSAKARKKMSCNLTLCNKYCTTSSCMLIYRKPSGKFYARNSVGGAAHRKIKTAICAGTRTKSGPAGC